MTRISGVLLTVILAVATALVKVDLGLIAPMGAPLPGAELDIALIAGLVSVVILGPGRFSLDYLLRLDVAPARVERASRHVARGEEALATSADESAPAAR